MAAGRWRRDLKILLVGTLPFAVVAGGLMLASQSPWAAGWQPLTLFLYAVGVAAIWGIAVLGYLVWILIRDGWRRSSLPAAAVLLLVAGTAAVWGVRTYAEEAACERAYDFFATLPDIPAVERRAAIGEAGRTVTRPSICGIQGLADTLLPEPSSAGEGIEDGHSDAEPDEQRLAVLADLLQAGLPPEEHLLHLFAAYAPDPAAVRLLLSRRAWLNARNPDDWPLVPDATVRDVLDRAGPCGVRPGDGVEGKHLAVLRVLVEAAPDLPASLDPSRRARLDCLLGA